MRCLREGPREWEGGIKIDGRGQVQENASGSRWRIKEANDT